MSYFAKTDKGKKRRMNQDYVYATEERIGVLPNLFLLADGMGGHKAGDYASRSFVEGVRKEIENTETGNPVKVLKAAIEHQNARIFSEARRNENLSGMGTTLTCCFIDGRSMTVGNVGDSRLYHLHGSSLRQVTRDHSFVEEMVQKGYMIRGSREYLRQKNIITRAIGQEESVEVDFFEVELMPGDSVLLCTDGLSNMVDNESISQLLQDEAPVKERALALIDMANINGGFDNIGVILIDQEGRKN